jgi:erythritol transport system ATP-binding protein
MTGGASLAPRARLSTEAGTRLLSVKDVRVRPRPGRNAVDGVSFEVGAGEIVGLYGLMGAGRTELLESVLGVHADATGEVRLDGEPLEALPVSARVAAGLAMVPEDRKAPARGTCRENMSVEPDELSVAGTAERQRAHRLPEPHQARPALIDR